MLLRWGVKAALPNTWKQTQGGCQNKETKKIYGPNERTEQHSRKRTNKMEISNLSDAELKILVTGMLKELIGVLQQHKKDPGRDEVYTK